MRRSFSSIVAVSSRFHVFGSLAIVVFATTVIATQISDRQNFANSELYREVVDRWGAPIDQPAPSVRYVESGVVFTQLSTLELASQDVRVNAAMNYRKRGLVYFSGFDFAFDADYSIANPLERAIDVVFVFPVALDRNRVLLQGLRFEVDGETQPAELGDGRSALVWTGRLEPEEKARVSIHFEGRGLDSFTYRLDPAVPAKDFAFSMTVNGGHNFDYPGGVVPAHDVVEGDEGMTMRWAYPALESGVPVGTVLPSEKSFDTIIKTMAVRAWVPFLGLLIALTVLASLRGRVLRFYESYLVAAAYGFFFVLLSYLAAFMNFYAAYAASIGLVGALLVAHGTWILGRDARARLVGLVAAFLFVPTLAAIAQGYTGLIYTFEILTALTLVMFLSSRISFEGWAQSMATEEQTHGA